MPDNMRINIRAMTPDEHGFSYTQPDLIEASGCIGHLRVDMGTTGTQFFSSWDDNQASLKTQDFKAEFDEFINALRNDPEYDGILTNRATMASYCLRHPEAGFENSRDYGFRADTDKYSYMLRLNPNRGEYAVYCYAYEKEQLDRYLYDKPTEKEISVPEEAQDPPKKSPREKLKEITDSIEKGIRDVFTSGKYQQYLQTMSRFHRYSVNNTMLIYMQKPDATLVAGFNKWKDEFKRSVKKGEKGIKIIAPAAYKKTVETMKLDPDTKAPILDENGQAIMETKEISIPRFRVATVFDLSQTDGKPLPELASVIKGDVKHYEAFLEALERSSPVPVSYEKMPESCDGVFREGKQSIGIRLGMSEAQTVAALVHEITHSKLHNAVFPAQDDPRKYQEVTVLGQSGLFSPERMDAKVLPGGLFKYELRASKEHPTEPSSIENKVSKDFFGTVITAKPVDLSKTGFHEISYPADLSLQSKSSTLKEFFHDHKKDRRTQEVEAESVAYSVCQYYGIETSENSFGYLASWSSDKEVSELRDSLTTITATANALITDIDRNFREVCKERGIDPREVLTEPEPVVLDTYPMPDPGISMDAIAAFGEEGKDLLPVGKELAQAFYDKNLEVIFVENGQLVMAFETDDISSQPEGTVFGIPREIWEEQPQFQKQLAERLKNQEAREATFDACPDDCYAIYQVKHDDGIFSALAFRDYAQVTETGHTPNRSDYDLKYTAASTEPVTPEKLFEQFNMNRPGDFGGHSLSVSDIVAIKQGGQVSYYYCDDIGFKELPDFRKPVNYLKAAELSTEDDYGRIDGIINNGPKEEKEQKPSVLEKLKSQPPQEKTRKAPKKSAEREI